MTKQTRIVAGVLAAGALIAAFILLPVNQWLLDAVAWIQGVGPIGAVLYGALYVIATVAFLPASLLTLGAGFVYGPVWGFLIVWPAATVGATLAYLLGRTLLREQVQRKLEGYPRFSAIDRAITQKGARLLVLMRLSPAFPFGLMNYASGLTGISAGGYLLATAVGIAPGTLMYVYLGSTLSTLSAISEGSFEGGGAQQGLYWAGLVATVVVTVVITRMARRAVADQVEPTQTSEETTS